MSQLVTLADTSDLAVSDCARSASTSAGAVLGRQDDVDVLGAMGRAHQDAGNISGARRARDDVNGARPSCCRCAMHLTQRAPHVFGMGQYVGLREKCDLKVGQIIERGG